MESYFTIQTPGEGLYKEKGSKFLSFAFPVASEEAIREKIQEIRTKFHDARHYCYAYVLGEEGLVYKANDDGEPNHSAGDPILRQIRSKGLTDTLVIVIRYFGGTKLGVSGLVNAYRTAAQEALNTARSVEILITLRLTLRFPYETTNQVMKLIKHFKIKIIEQTFLDDCTITGRIQPKHLPALQDKSKLIRELHVSIDD